MARQLSPENGFSFENTTIDDRKIVVLTIPCAKEYPTAFNGERFIRIGSSKANLRKYPKREADLFKILKDGYPTIVNTESQYQDLTFEKLFTYYAGKGISLRQNTFKKNLSLTTQRGKYNIMAQLLSDNSHIPVRVAIFAGENKAAPMYSVKEFGYTCLLVTVDKILEYGDVINIPQANERNRVVERLDIPLFDQDAFREAIINAFLHNAWVTENEPMITIYSNRIEILSRGTIGNDQTMEGFFEGESKPINRELSDIFLQLHISERTGRGVPIITNAYGKEAYDFRQNSIAVNIPFNWIKVMGDKMGDKLGDNKVTFSPHEEKIISLLRDNPNMTKAELAKQIGLGKTSIDNYISLLDRKSTRLNSSH